MSINYCHKCNKYFDREKEVVRKIQHMVLDLIFDTRNSQEYVRGFMSCKTYVDGMLFQYLHQLEEKENKK